MLGITVLLPLAPFWKDLPLHTYHDCLRCKNKHLNALVQDVLLVLLVLPGEMCVDRVLDILQILDSQYLLTESLIWIFIQDEHFVGIWYNNDNKMLEKVEQRVQCRKINLRHCCHLPCCKDSYHLWNIHLTIKINKVSFSQILLVSSCHVLQNIP